MKLSTKNARILCKFRTGNVKPVDGFILRETIEYVTYAIAMLVMSSITFSIVHLYLLKEMSTYLVTIQIEQVHFLFSIYSLPQKKSLLCKLCKYLLIVIFRVNIYCILRQEPLQKTLCESILFIVSPYCTRCSLMRINCLVLSCLVLSCNLVRMFGPYKSDAI